jgi:hypothetical protein
MTDRNAVSSVASQPPRRKSRTYNVRLIRRDYSYTVQEIAELFNLHPNAVRRWVKDKLRTIDTHRPQLIHGSDLIEFLSRRQQGRKRGCGPDEMYCFGCHEPRRPAGGRVAVEHLGPSRLILRGSCELCGTRMNRAISTSLLREVERTFAVTLASPRLVGTSAPIDMCEPILVGTSAPIDMCEPIPGE